MPTASIDKLIQLDRERPVGICICGDSMIDQYIHGHLAIGQENCPKFVEDSRVVVPGGAANAARQLANWQAKAWLVGIGDTRWPGEPLPYNCQLMHFGGILSLKTRHLVDGRHIYRHDLEQHGYGLSEGDLAACRQKSIDQICRRVHMGEFQAVLIADYDKGFMDAVMIREIIHICVKFGIPVVADAKRHPSVYAGAILKVNEDYANKFSEHCQYRRVVTMGVNSPAGLEKPINLPPVTCLNHVGAGDCFAAHLALALAHGLPLEEAASIAHSAGRCYVQHHHNRPPFPHEIRRDILSASNDDPGRGKVVAGAGHNAGASGGLAALRRSIPGRVVFTNGVYRLPHAGHAFGLQWARQQGDALVVGVNSDASVARLQAGGSNYCLPINERLAMLASMQAVDWLVVFDGDTPVDVIRELQPDVLVKGSEYAAVADDIPGSELVADVRFAPSGPFAGRHVTTLVADIQRREAGHGS